MAMLTAQVLQEGEQILHGLVLHFDCMFMACVVTFHCRVLPTTPHMPQHAHDMPDVLFWKRNMLWQFSIHSCRDPRPHP